MKHGIKAKLSVFIGFAVLLTAVVFLSAQREDAKVLELIAEEGTHPLIDFLAGCRYRHGVIVTGAGYSAGSSDLLYPGWK